MCEIDDPDVYFAALTSTAAMRALRDWAPHQVFAMYATQRRVMLCPGQYVRLLST